MLLTVSQFFHACARRVPQVLLWLLPLPCIIIFTQYNTK
jgi:hypothetical protein